MTKYEIVGLESLECQGVGLPWIVNGDSRGVLSDNLKTSLIRAGVLREVKPTAEEVADVACRYWRDHMDYVSTRQILSDAIVATGHAEEIIEWLKGQS